MQTRKQQAQQVRNNAAAKAANRPYPTHRSNGEEFEYRRSDPATNGQNLKSILTTIIKLNFEGGFSNG